MQFDDRLATVLDQPADNPRDRAVQWRQLVDLIARGAPAPDAPMVVRALDRIAEGQSVVPEELRAAAARGVAGLDLPAALVAIFAGDTPAVATPVLAAARLNPDDWRTVLSGATPVSRGFIETLHPELREATPGAPTAPPAADLTSEPLPSIDDMVARIEAIRQGVKPSAPVPQPPAPPPAVRTAAAVSADSPALFRWECSPSGDIEWVEGAPRGALIGRSIALAGNGDGVDRAVERAFARRSPFRDAGLSLGGEGLLAGNWRISGIPAFEPTDGRFAGYRGVARRDGALLAAPPAPGTSDSVVALDHDSLRELVHEIKTPLNAIIGFAEIIDGQYLGPAHRSYRERAAEIVRQARTLLVAIDDLDFAARLQSDRSRPGLGTDIAAFFTDFARRLGDRSLTHGVLLEYDFDAANVRCALEPDLVERLLDRFLGSVIDSAHRDELLRLSVGRQGKNCAIAISRPRSTAGASEPELVDPSYTVAISAERGDVLGLGFALRLVRGLARIAGGDLDVADNALTLLIPLADAQ